MRNEEKGTVFHILLSDAAGNHPQFAANVLS
jgi:hypothetical protein